MSEEFESVWDKSKDILWGFSRDEAFAIWSAAKEASNLDGVAVEVGCMFGSTAKIIASACSPLFCVDPFSAKSLSGMKPYTHHDEVYRQFLANISGDEYDIAVIRDVDSSVWDYWRLKVRFLHLDHCHTFRGTLASLNNWRPHLADGAIVALHDYADPRYPGIRNAVNETDLVVEQVVDSLALGRFPSK